MLFESVAFAQAAQPVAADPKMQFIPFIIVALIMYFLLIRPTQKKQKKHREMVSQLKRGDEVWTTGGMFGVIELIEENIVKLRVSENTIIKMLKSQISTQANQPPPTKTAK
jgi:preprotein translocase subunit YajC